MNHPYGKEKIGNAPVKRFKAPPHKYRSILYRKRPADKGREGVREKCVQWSTGGDRIEYIQGRQTGVSTYTGLAPRITDSHDKPYSTIIGGITQPVRQTRFTEVIIGKLISKSRENGIAEKKRVWGDNEIKHMEAETGRRNWRPKAVKGKDVT